MRLILFLQALLVVSVVLFYPEIWTELTILLLTFWSGYLTNEVYGKTASLTEEADEEDSYDD